MRTIMLSSLMALLAPSLAQAADCPAPSAAQPLRAGVIVPLANELTPGRSELGAANGVLSQAYDEAQSADQVLLRLRIESCHNVATATPAPSVVSPDNPAAYQPKTQYDNTPWRFNMNQNGKNMTADEFSAWMKARGVRVAKGANATDPAAASGTTAPAMPAPAPAPAPTQAPPPPAPANPPKPD